MLYDDESSSDSSDEEDLDVLFFCFFVFFFDYIQFYLQDEHLNYLQYKNYTYIHLHLHCTAHTYPIYTSKTRRALTLLTILTLHLHLHLHCTTHTHTIYTSTNYNTYNTISNHLIRLQSAYLHF